MKKIRMDMFTAIIRIIVGLLLTGFSIWTLVTVHSQKSRCSEEVTGTVVRLEKQQIRSRTEYRPVFE